MTSTQDRHSDYLQRMLAAAAQVKSYTEGMAKEDFLADPKTQDAVVMKLLVIGELAAQLLEEQADFASMHPQVPWQQMKGMRNRMAHGYFELDMEIVWDTVQAAIPELEANLRSID
jgi:uncharacterized protein with HEPN domain